MKTGLRLFLSHRSRSAVVLGLLAVIGLGTYVTPVSAVPASRRPAIAEQPDGRQFVIRGEGDERNNWIETEAGYTIARDAQGFWQYVTGFERSLVADGLGAEPFPVEQPVLSGVDATEPPPPGILPHLHSTTTRPVSPASSLVATTTAPGSLPAAAVAAGTRRLLLILAEFADRQGTHAQPAWTTGYSDRIADYYSKMSYGRIAILPADEDDSLLPDPDNRIHPAASNGVIGWVNISSTLRQLEIDHSMADDQTGNHPNTHGDDTKSKYNRLVARAAMMAATPYIDWAQYDYDHDGSVTADELAVLVVVAGFEAAVTGSPQPSIYAHAGDTGAEGELRLGGKLLGMGATRPGLGPMQVTSGYGMFGEQGQEKTTPYQLPIGTPLHELGHSLFALPDLYEVDTSVTCPDDSPNRGIGAWSLMAAGSDGYRLAPEEYPGTTPVSLDAWSRLVLGWVNPITVRERAELTAGGDPEATADNTVYKAVVNNNNANEYFLIENRQNSGFDRGLQWPLGANFAGGVLVYHIDDSIDCTENKCNSRAGVRHPRVHLETGGRACISKDTGFALDSDAYRKGSKGSAVTVFLNAKSTPSDSRLWIDKSLEKGLSSGITIRDISAAASVMRVRVIREP